MNLADKISNSELEVMRILWRENTPVSFTDIRLELQQAKGWEKSTIHTLIRRLADKKVIAAEKKDVLYYTPNIMEDAYNDFQMNEIVERLYGGNAKSLVAALCHGGKLNEDDIDELKAYFRMEGIK